MASFPQNHLQQFLQQPPSQQQQSKPFFRDFCSDNNMDGQISQQVNFFNTPNLLDHHPPYIPPFQVPGLAPGPVLEEKGVDLEWGFGLEPKKKRPEEQVSLDNNINNNDNNSQISSVDLLRARSVSTGLGLSLENPRLASSGDSALLGLVGDNLDLELQRQDAEFDRCIRLQGDHLRQVILEKFQANQLQTISYVEEKVLQNLRQKEAEVDAINKKNTELELRMEQLALEANAWQQQARHNENMINTLNLNLQQLVYAQSRDSKEGCGDSEIDDTASCCNGRPIDINRLRKDSNGTEMMTCKVCRVNKVSMLLLPCKHLCLCKDCESKLSLCPLCQSSKYIGMEVYM